MARSRQQLLQRLDTIERRVARLASVDPLLEPLGTRIDEQQQERSRARARLDALDERVAGLTRRPAASDSGLQESLRNILNERLTSVADEAEARLSCRGPEGRIMERVANLETAVAAQRNVITELRDCSMRNEERMQRILTSVDSLISGNLRRNSR